MSRERETARMSTGKRREIIAKVFRRGREGSLSLLASGQYHMCLLALAFYYGRNKEEGPYRTLVTGRADAWLYESHAGQTSRSNMRRKCIYFIKVSTLDPANVCYV